MNVFSQHILSVLSVVFSLGDGCGHTILRPMSGTVASRNYPGTYPNHTQCAWSLKVPTGYTLNLTFGDFDLEWSKDCKAGSLTITDKSKAIILGREFMLSFLNSKIHNKLKQNEMQNY